MSATPPTPNHPFWSEDRLEFVRADELVVGETLRTTTGQTRITSIVPRAGPHTVYNIEVFGTHVYQVSRDGVLVHNTGMDDCFDVVDDLARTTPDGRMAETVTVRSYTDVAGRVGITETAELRPNSWVTVPDDIPSGAGHVQIEEILEIQPGRGVTFVEIDVPSTNLRIPDQGPFTSGGARQWQINEPVPINAGDWRLPPGRPPKILLDLD